MKKTLVFTGLMAAILSLGGCATQTQVVSKAESAEFVTATLSDNDFENAARVMLDDMLTYDFANGKPGGGRYVLEIAEIKNNTMQRIDTAELTDYIRKELRRSGKFVLTNLGENDAIRTSRDLADSELVNSATVAKKKKVIAADTSLFGRISQKDNIVNGKKRIDYVFSLAVTELETGLELWSSKEVITKITDKNTQTW